MRVWIACFALVWLQLGCIRGGVLETDGGKTNLPLDSGSGDVWVEEDGGTVADASSSTSDAGETDAGGNPGLADGGEPDAGSTWDGGRAADDAGLSGGDAGGSLEDAGGAQDAGDAGVGDAGRMDAGATDAGSPDAGDAGDAAPDAGGPNYCEGLPASLQVQILPQNANTTHDLSLQVRTSDGCDYPYVIEWARNDFVQAGLAQEWLVDKIHTTRGDTWTATVWVEDVLGGMPTLFSASRTIGNAPPAVAVGLPVAPTVDAALQISLDAFDPDGDDVNYTIRWSRDGVPYAPANDQEAVPASQLRPSEIWRVVVTPDDGAIGGTTGIATATILDRKPTLRDVIVSPSTPDANTPIQATAVANDPDGTPTELSWEWRVSGAVVPGATSATLLPGAYKKDDEIIAVATAVSGSLSSEPMASNRLRVVNTPPDVTVVALSPPGFTSADPIRCDAVAIDPDGDDVYLKFQWVRNPSTTPVVISEIEMGPMQSSEPGPALSAGSVSRGQEIACRVTPNDGQLAGTTRVATAITANSPPSLAAVSLEPSDPPPTSMEEIRCVPTGLVNLESDPITYTVVWRRYVDGVVAGIKEDIYPGLSSEEAQTFVATLAPGFAQRGYEVGCSITPNDGVDSGDTRTAESRLEIRNAPPSLRHPPQIVPAVPQSKDPLTCDAEATDPDNDDVDFLYTWYKSRNGRPPELLQAESADATLQPGSATRFERVYCEARPTDGNTNGIGTAVASSPVEIENTPPALDRATLTPLDAVVTSPLVCTGVGLYDFDDGGEISTQPEASGTPTVQTRVKWYVDGTPVPSTNLTSEYVAKGKRIQCGVTPYDASDDGVEVLSNVVTIRDTPGQMSPPRIEPVAPGTAPRSEQTLTCSPGAVTDPDVGDTPVDFSFRWVLENGAELHRSTGLYGELGPDKHSRGQRVGCEVTARFGGANLPLVQAVSSFVEILDTAPTVASVTVQPTSPSTSVDLQCVPAGGTDVDGDSISYNYKWYIKSVGDTSFVLSANATNTLPKRTVYWKDRVYCTATPKTALSGGAYVQGEPVSSTPIDIVNAPPQLDAAVVTPVVPTVESTFHCTGKDFHDVDANKTFAEITTDDYGTIPFAYVYRGVSSQFYVEKEWIVNGTRVGNALTASHVRKGNAIACALKPHDGYDAGQEKTSTAVVIRDTPGRLEGTHITPYVSGAEPRSDQTLTCQPGTFIDPDQEDVPLSYTYRWLLSNGAELAVGQQLAGGQLQKGDRVRCEATAVFATPAPGQNALPPVKGTSSEVTLQNGKPRVDSVVLLPAVPNAYATLEAANLQVSDPDGDGSLKIKYTWTLRDGTVLASEPNYVATTTQIRLPPVDPSTGVQRFTKDDWVDLTVISWDGALAGDPYVASIQIGNILPDPVNARLRVLERDCWVDAGGSGTPCAPPVRHADKLVCVPPADAPTTDIDGDAVSYIAEWSLDGVNYSTKPNGYDGFPYGQTNTPGDTMHYHYPPVGAVAHCRLIAVDADTDPAEGHRGASTQIAWEDGPWQIPVDVTADAPLSAAGASSLKCEDTNGGCSLRAAMTLARSVASNNQSEGVRVQLAPGETYTLDLQGTAGGDLEALGPFELYGDAANPPTIRPKYGGIRLTNGGGTTWGAVLRYLKFDCSSLTNGGVDTVLDVGSGLDVELQEVDFKSCGTAIHLKGGEIDAESIAVDGDNGKGYSAIRMEAGSAGSLRYLTVQNRGNRGNPSGSALEVKMPGGVTLVEPYFSNNVAIDGAHVWFDANGPAEKIRIETGNFLDGWASNLGGAIYMPNSGTLELVDTLISGNEAKRGGGLYAAPKSTTAARLIPTLYFAGTVFQGNVAYEGYGGGLYLTAARTQLKGLVIGGAMNESCTANNANVAYTKKGLTSNSNRSYGGGLYSERVELEIMLDENSMPYKSYMRCNQAASNYGSTGGYGGGIWFVQAGQSDANFASELTTPLTYGDALREGFRIYQNEKCRVCHPGESTGTCAGSPDPSVVRIVTCETQNVNVSVAVCGNGYVESTETCDDGNRVDNDGCSNTCGQ